jgi:hypothetical protein
MAIDNCEPADQSGRCERKVVGRCTYFVVTVARLDLGQNKLVLEQVMHCKFEGAGNQLAGNRFTK